MSTATTGVEIAIVGMAGRFPGAPDIDAFWHLLRDGVEAVRTFSDAELLAAGVPEATWAAPGYVKAGIVLDGVDQFDAPFFGYTPRDAQQLDPQQRVFLETAWHALEHAGYAGAETGPVGVYAGSGANLYLLRHLLPTLDARSNDIAALLGVMNGNDKDSLATRIAYKLNLRGPAVSVQTACSTSLVAVHMACRGLLNYEADMALAGGVWLNLMQGSGYAFQPGAILSPDGHCRAFDAQAAGTVIGSGSGVVVLKRLDDALADGDTIHAIIKGSAMNNDGADKVGYTAPSVSGQAAVIQAAQAMAETPADSISYVEAHGTGTALGDPIEIAALTQAFRASTERTGYCAIGSLKTNIGHLDAAAGVAGLIKTTLALQHQTLPPSLNYRQPNPQIDFASSPFFVNTQSRAWPRGNGPRRAGLSSFGMGGTNVHVVLEEAPTAVATPGHGLHTLCVSARSAHALDVALRQLADHLAQQPQQSLTDVAHTLRMGRKRFEHRAVALVQNHADAVRVLRERTADGFVAGRANSPAPVAFMFPGQGAQHVGMGAALYASSPVFKATLDDCCQQLIPHLGLDLRQVLFADAAAADSAGAQLNQTALTQPALFAVEYAMAQHWLSLGIQAAALVGHSIGEYVAACVAGVFSLADALRVVAARGRLLQATEPGAMLAVNLPEADLQPWLAADCDLAAVNADGLCVLSGSLAAIANAERDLLARGVVVRRLQVSHAFHSGLVEPMLARFAHVLASVPLQAPQIPFVSNLSGRWISAAEATSTDYWVRHVRGTVRFADSVPLLASTHTLLEVGPGDTLCRLARRWPGLTTPVFASQAHATQTELNTTQAARCLAQLWVSGQEPVFTQSSARRVPLPLYPFERLPYWVNAAPALSPPAAPVETATRRAVADWFYAPAWVRAEAVAPAENSSGCTLLLCEPSSLGAGLWRHLQAQDRCLINVAPGKAYARLSERRYVVRPGERADFAELLRSVEAERGPITRVCHLWNLSPAGQPPQTDVLERGFYTLLALAQALSSQQQAALTVVVNQLEDVTGEETLHPDKATLHGPCKVISHEYPHLTCRLLDLVVPAAGADAEAWLVRQIAAEMCAPADAAAVAYRGLHRWVKRYEPVRRDVPVAQRLRKGGVVVITGGLGGVGLALARYLAQAWQARLVLISRSAVPPRPDWPALIAQGAAQSALLKQLLELETLGGQVCVLQADMADRAQVQAALDAARRQFGAVHGVIHAAGTAGGGVISQRSRADMARVFAPKLDGARNLLDLVRPMAPDFVLLCSSLTAITGGFGQADYCAANAYLDALATAEARSQQRHVVSVNWDVWRGVGMAADQHLPDDVGITAAEVGALLESLVNGPAAPQTLVSTLELARQFAQQQGLDLAARLLPTPQAKRQKYPRPTLSSAYVAPTSELEQDLAASWGDFLGLDAVGVHDNLFELGGDSLLAVQLLASVRTHYGVDVHPGALFGTPTLSALAVLIETRLIEEIEAAEAAPGHASALV